MEDALPPVATDRAEPWFKEVAKQSGLEFRYEMGHDKKFYLPEIMAGGVGLLDYDMDGNLDVYFVQAGYIIDGAGNAPGNRLFRNRGDGTFEDVTERTGLGDTGYGLGCSTADYDNDGWTDLFVTNIGVDVLFHNNGDGTFSDVTRKAGIVASDLSTSSAFVDYDRDGDLDLYVVNYIRWSADEEPDCLGFDGVPDYCIPTAYLAPQPDVLYRNNGDGTFTDVSVEAGLHERYGNGLGVVCGDFSGDGLTDILVANDLMANQLWINQGDGTFRDEAIQRGAGLSGDGLAEAGMGIAVGDIDDDGDPDLFITHFTGQTNTLYRNEAYFFVDITTSSGLDTSLPNTGFGTALHDFNNDGVLDIYVANGRVVVRRGTPAGQDPYADPNQLYMGLGDATFREIMPEGGTSQRLWHSSRAAAFGDLNNDGRIDIVVANRDAPAYVLINQTDTEEHWIMFRVLERHGSDAIGARVDIESGGTVRSRIVRTAYSYCAANDPRVHFGLGKTRRVEKVRVTWADGTLQTFDGFDADQIVVLKRQK